MINTFIFDIDGTLADAQHRRHLLDHSTRQEFLDASVDDTEIENVAKLCRMLAANNNILFVTARREEYRMLTENWLLRQELPFDGGNLLMAETDDIRDDEVIKEEIFINKIKPHYNVIGIFEDNVKCINMWRELGLTCYDVGRLW